MRSAPARRCGRVSSVVRLLQADVAFHAGSMRCPANRRWPIPCVRNGRISNASMGLVLGEAPRQIAGGVRAAASSRACWPATPPAAERAALEHSLRDPASRTAPVSARRGPPLPVDCDTNTSRRPAEEADPAQPGIRCQGYWSCPTASAPRRSRASRPSRTTSNASKREEVWRESYGGGPANRVRRAQ